MRPMPLTVTWDDLALRLALTVIAGALIGVNREEHGRPAGLRTTLLVCLAASVAMIQANLLLPTNGKPPDSFITLDLMRLPLGILSGMGFMGAGAIVRRSDLVLGVTTAATLWIVTVIGLCFGGGQITLGVCATALGLATLWGLRRVELHIRQDHQGTLVVTTGPDGPNANDVSRHLETEGYRIVGQAAAYSDRGCEMQYDVRWRASRLQVGLPGFVPELAKRAGVQTLRWNPQGFGRA